MSLKRMNKTEVVAAAVEKWIHDTDVLLELFEHVLEECHIPATASRDLRKIIPNLPPTVRQCRAQKPTRAVIQLWLRTLQADTVGQERST
jgi:hypothetical protein